MEIKEFKNNDLDTALLKDYIKASKDPDFVKLVNKIGVSEDVAKKYTSKLEKCVAELKNCKNCKNICECKNTVTGCVSYPRKDHGRLKFDYVACKYQQEIFKKEAESSITFEEPLAIKEASMAEIDVADKKRTPIIKWIKNFYKEYKTNKHIKGLYLHGSFGSGKSYMLAALLNELAKNKTKCTIIYYPEMLRLLKSSFDDDYEEKIELLKTTDVLLIDDIGAESVTPWSRDEVLGTILQYRMDSVLPTFFTSNLTLDELETHLATTKNGVDVVKARRIIERVKQLTEELELISENRRK